MSIDPSLLQALDDLLCVYDFLLRGERAEGDRARLEAILAPKLRPMDPVERDTLFAVFVEKARSDGWVDEGILEFLAWLEEELGIERRSE